MVIGNNFEEIKVTYTEFDDTGSPMGTSRPSSRSRRASNRRIGRRGGFPPGLRPGPPSESAGETGTGAPGAGPAFCAAPSRPGWHRRAPRGILMPRKNVRRSRPQPARSSEGART